MANTDINRVNLIGRLTRDPEIRQIPSGTSVASFSLANNRVWLKDNEKQEEVSYFNCIIWGKAGEALARYAKKGQKIAIEGRLQQRRWQDNDGNNKNTIEIVCDTFQFLSFNNDSEGAQNSGQADNSNQAPEVIEDSSIPF